MMAASLALGWRLLVFFGAGVLGGVANGIAGGGSFITFPAMLTVGIPALRANVSSTVGILGSYAGGLRGFRHELGEHRALIRSLVPTCAAGTLLGCAFLLLGSPRTFHDVVPWLIGAATLLFLAAPRITARLAAVDQHHPGRRWTLHVGLFLVSAYGGYFGAGMGIMLLAVMALTLPISINALQGLRNALSLIVNLIAALVFAIRGHLALDAVYMIFAGTLIGGWLGTMLIRRLSASWVRALVVASGVAAIVYLVTQ
jgi:uncharacterized protein